MINSIDSPRRSDNPMGKFSKFFLFIGHSDKQEQSFRFAVLLVTLVAAILIPPYFEGQSTLKNVWSILSSLVMLAALYSLAGGGRQMLLWLVLLLIPSFLTSWLPVFSDAHWIIYADNVTSILYFSLVGFYLGRFVMGTRAVSLNVIYAGLCLYIILALIWGSLYNLHYIYYESAFAFSNEALVRLASHPDTTVNLFNYYSFVTLTTLGYGDIVPLNAVTQAWVAVEAMVGQFYVAIIIASLVSSYPRSQ